MQALDFVKFSELVAAGIAAQSKEMKDAVAAYQTAVAEWDKRNNLSKELETVQGQKTELANAQVLFSREQDAFKARIAEFNAKVDKEAATDKARKEELAKLAKQVEAATLACEQKEQATQQSMAAKSAELTKKATELEAFQAELNQREQALTLRENKLKAAQVSLGKALA